MAIINMCDSESDKHITCIRILYNVWKRRLEEEYTSRYEFFEDSLHEK